MSQFVRVGSHRVDAEMTRFRVFRLRLSGYGGQAGVSPVAGLKRLPASGGRPVQSEKKLCSFT